MNKRVIVGLVIAVVLAALGYLAYLNFEIVPKKIKTEPLREISMNDYAALERWLGKAGCYVRTVKQGNPSQIAQAAEKVVLAEDSACTWENAVDILIPWIESGGNLILIMDKYSGYYIEEDNGLHSGDFLVAMGIGITTETLNDEANETDTDETNPNKASAIKENDASYDTERPFPNLSHRLCFSILENADLKNIVFIKDPKGNIRLVRVHRGAGFLTVTSRPLFMFNDYLKNDVNAQWAWELTGAQMPEGSGMLFIRQRRTAAGLFGKIAERGNFLPLIVSAIILIIIGFWMVTPVFGLMFTEKQSVSRPLRERLLAEIRFLKNYESLESYLYAYLSEIKLKGKYDEECAAIEQALCKDPAGRAKYGRVWSDHALSDHTWPLKYRDIIRCLRKLQFKLQWSAYEKE